MTAELYAQIGQEPGELDTTRESKYKQILSIRAVHFLAIFALIYIGVEVTVGGKFVVLVMPFQLTGIDIGWIVTFIIKQRDGGQSAGYISSGFFGGEFSLMSNVVHSMRFSYLGLTLGRIGLMWLNKMVSQRNMAHSQAISSDFIRSVNAESYLSTPYSLLGNHHFLRPAPRHEVHVFVFTSDSKSPSGSFPPLSKTLWR